MQSIIAFLHSLLAKGNPFLQGSSVPTKNMLYHLFRQIKILHSLSPGKAGRQEAVQDLSFAGPAGQDAV